MATMGFEGGNGKKKLKITRRNGRIQKEEQYMSMAYIIAKRSTCLRREVGAVLVRKGRIISTGYNGSPRNCVHCEEIGCYREQHNIPSGQATEYCRAAHAESNAISNAAFVGVSTENAYAYVTTKPCIDCAKNMINAGIIKIVYNEEYAGEESETDKIMRDLLKESSVILEKYDGRIPQITFTDEKEEKGKITLE
tara:strand:+ start:867 stop:1451 length:585 start_codon:yes stop_codon:yes gene_type:complete